MTSAFDEQIRENVKSSDSFNGQRQKLRLEGHDGFNL
jgi:hypothetical protein